MRTSVLDVACGSGGPAVRVARWTGCSVLGIDIHPDGVAAARDQARAAGLAGRGRRLSRFTYLAIRG